MKIHTCLVTYNRLELTRQAIASYLATVDVDFTLAIVDNGSEDGTREWLVSSQRNMLWRSGDRVSIILLEENRYPGYACNRGWEALPDDCEYLHRADNDFEFLPGWTGRVLDRFESDTLVGQVGLRTDEEELFAEWNTGGNCMIRRVLWNAGIRWDERPWTEYPPGHSEDGILSQDILGLGWLWTRVKEPCIVPLASGDWSDPYYQKSYGDRQIAPP